MTYTIRDLFRDLRNGPYTSIGSYPVFFYTTDGGVLSHASVLANIRTVARSTRDRLNDGWTVAGAAVNWEDPELYCDDTGERIPSAYAEPN